MDNWQPPLAHTSTLPPRCKQNTRVKIFGGKKVDLWNGNHGAGENRAKNYSQQHKVTAVLHLDIIGNDDFTFISDNNPYNAVESPFSYAVLVGYFQGFHFSILPAGLKF